MAWGALGFQERLDALYDNVECMEVAVAELGFDNPVVFPMRPAGESILYPTCAVWNCDDYFDWEWIGPDSPDYSAVKREHRIVAYHEPGDDWLGRLQKERDKRNGGKPLWAP